MGKLSSTELFIRQNFPCVVTIVAPQGNRRLTVERLHLLLVPAYTGRLLPLFLHNMGETLLFGYTCVLTDALA